MFSRTTIVLVAMIMLFATMSSAQAGERGRISARLNWFGAPDFSVTSLTGDNSDNDTNLGMEGAFSLTAGWAFFKNFEAGLSVTSYSGFVNKNEQGTEIIQKTRIGAQFAAFTPWNDFKGAAYRIAIGFELDLTGLGIERFSDNGNQMDLGTIREHSSYISLELTGKSFDPEKNGMPFVGIFYGRAITTYSPGDIDQMSLKRRTNNYFGIRIGLSVNL